MRLVQFIKNFFCVVCLICVVIILISFIWDERFKPFPQSGQSHELVQSGPTQSGFIKIDHAQSGATPVRREREPMAAVVEPSRGYTPEMLSRFRKFDMNASAYTLSEQSCGKIRTAPGYGKTATGTRATAFRTVSVDPGVIALGSELYIEFPEPFEDRNGVYVAEDTGGGIRGNHVDIFFGEDAPGETKVEKEALKFGRRQVIVYLIEMEE